MLQDACLLTADCKETFTELPLKLKRLILSEYLPCSPFALRAGEGSEFDSVSLQWSKRADGFMINGFRVHLLLKHPLHIWPPPKEVGEHFHFHFLSWPNGVESRTLWQVGQEWDSRLVCMMKFLSWMQRKCCFYSGCWESSKEVTLKFPNSKQQRSLVWTLGSAWFHSHFGTATYIAIG